MYFEIIKCCFEFSLIIPTIYFIYLQFFKPRVSISIIKELPNYYKLKIKNVSIVNAYDIKFKVLNNFPCDFGEYTSNPDNFELATDKFDNKYITMMSADEEHQWFFTMIHADRKIKQSMTFRLEVSYKSKSGWKYKSVYKWHINDVIGCN